MLAFTNILFADLIIAKSLDFYREDESVTHNNLDLDGNKIDN